MTDTRSPVSETPLSQQGKSLQAALLTARRGLATNIASLDRGPDYCRVLNNLQMIIRGIWTSIGIGWTRQRAGAFNAAAAFKEFSFFLDNTGVKTLLFQVGDKLYSYVGTTETQILAGLSTTALPCIRRSFSSVSGQSIVIYCNGVSQPQKITSPSAATPLLFNSPGVWPGTFNGKSYATPKFCESFGDRFVYAGFPGAATAFDLLISNQGNPEAFTQAAPITATDCGSFTYPPELGQLTALRSLKLSNQTNDEIIIGGCTDGVFIITGSNATNYSLKILTKEFGIPSNRCMVQVGNELIFLSTKGIRTFTSVAANAVLTTDTLSYLIQDLINQIDPAAWGNAHAVHYPASQEIWFWVPFIGDGTSCKHAFILNYNNEDSIGGNLSPIWSTRDGTAVACSINFGGVFYGGGYDGLLQQWYSGNLYDTAAINFQITTPLISLGNPSQKASMRNITVVTDGGAQQFTIRANIYQRLSGGNFRKTPGRPSSRQLTSAAAGATALGSWKLGISAFPSNHIKPLDFQPAGNGQYWEIELVSTSAADALDYYGVAYTLSGGGIER